VIGHRRKNKKEVSMNISDLISPLIGGGLIGLSAMILLFFTGKICGLSGIARAAVFSNIERSWKLAFLLGLLGGAFIYQQINPVPLPFREELSSPLLIIAGLLVGIGTRLGNGCTSGHGICGIGRFSKRSIVATMMFMLTAIITVAITNIFK
jgi:uncharacterized protein